MANIETLTADTRYWLEVAAPGTPAAGTVVTYAKSDGKIYSKDDAGSETLMSAGSAGIPDTIMDAKGDIIAATAADTAARLAVGANDLVLMAASGESTGLKWSYPKLGTTIDATLGANVDMTNANTFYDGPSASCAAGTWLFIYKMAWQVSGSVVHQFTVKLWDGTTVWDEAQTDVQDTTNGYVRTVTGMAIVVLGSTTTVKISGAAESAGQDILRNVTVNSASSNTATRLTGVRIA